MNMLIVFAQGMLLFAAGQVASTKPELGYAMVFFGMINLFFQFWRQERRRENRVESTRL
jgi:hypothetical protein